MVAGFRSLARRAFATSSSIHAASVLVASLIGAPASSLEILGGVRVDAGPALHGPAEPTQLVVGRPAVDQSVSTASIRSASGLLSAVPSC
jgi:hypothetical protein